jgi:hypothetical protein
MPNHHAGDGLHNAQLLLQEGFGLQYNMFASMTDNFDDGVMRDTPNGELSVVGRWAFRPIPGTSWNAYP